VHKATIINKNDKGAILELPYGIEGFVSAKNLQKEDGSKTEIGDSLDFKVLEFSKDDRRILLSHKATWSVEEEVAAAKRRTPPPAGKGKTIQNINQQTEKSTLGDIEALSALKEKLSGSGEAKDETKSE